MHEATLVAGILRIAEDEAHKHNVTHIVEIRLEIGLLACVEPQTLQGCFEIMTEGTMAQGAALHIQTAPLPCLCRQCGQRFTLHKKHFVCPSCHATELEFSGGHGCNITAIKVESQENTHG